MQLICISGNSETGGGQYGEFQIFEYFESNYSVLLSDNRANEVASYRY